MESGCLERVRGGECYMSLSVHPVPPLTLQARLKVIGNCGFITLIKSSICAGATTASTCHIKMLFPPCWLVGALLQKDGIPSSHQLWESSVVPYSLLCDCTVHGTLLSSCPLGTHFLPFSSIIFLWSESSHLFPIQSSLAQMIISLIVLPNPQ